jgi:hypothetical protein
MDSVLPAINGNDGNEDIKSNEWKFAGVANRFHKSAKRE